MKGQTKVVIFLILFFISIILFSSTNLWGRGIIQQNIDIVKIEKTEKFLKDLDNTILNLIEYGGTRRISYNIDSTIQLVGSNMFEISFPSTVTLPGYWINITSGDSSYIRERLEAEDLRVQLVYIEYPEYKIEFFTMGSRLTIPEYIFLAKNETFKNNDQTVIRIEISFMK